MSDVQFLEGQLEQRPGERIAYTVDTTRYGGSPTSPAVTVYDVSANVDAAGTDVSATLLATGESATVVGAVITTPHVVGVEGGKTYRLTVSFVAGGNTYAPFVYIHGKH